MNWWDLGEWSGTGGSKLATYQIACAFCGEKGNFETLAHLERQKRGGRKVLNYDTLKCGQCGNYMFAFWSAAGGIGGRGIHAYRLLPWHQTHDGPSGALAVRRGAILGRGSEEHRGQELD